MNRKSIQALLFCMGALTGVATPAWAETSSAEMLTGTAILLPSYVGYENLWDRAKFGEKSNWYADHSSPAARDARLSRAMRTPKANGLLGFGLAGSALILDGVTGSHLWNAVASPQVSDRHAKSSLGEELKAASASSRRSGSADSGLGK